MTLVVVMFFDRKAPPNVNKTKKGQIFLFNILMNSELI